ncbi:MAG: hypothetical protein P8L18_14200 [Verrucomicrobiota bacterium]|nr:hypothetical protein [Verrucomicrobiota bacterium]
MGQSDRKKYSLIDTFISLTKHTFRWSACCCLLQAGAEPFASRVLDYHPGIGFALEFSSGLGYTNISSVLGEPSRLTPGPFGGAVDPFSPPYQSSQLLSIGESGSLTLEFLTPIFDHPDHPDGMDFIIFGNTGFNIINGDYSGGGVTDGTMFGADEAQVTVWVSMDNETFYQLDPEKVPALNRPYPNDGQGDFRLPVPSSLEPVDFHEADLGGIRALYDGSGGGAAYDLAWTLGGLNLPFVRYLKIEVQRGKLEIDAVSLVAVSPLPPVKAVHEDFSSDPLADGPWKTFGDSDLFSWDKSQQRLKVTWDSRRPNSLFYLPLSSPISRKSDFTLRFRLQVDDLNLGIDAGKPFTFPIALGLVHLEQATRPDFYRGSGIHPDFGARGLVEWSYHADSGFGATVSSGLISLDNQWALSNSFPLELKFGSIYAVEMAFEAELGVLRTSMTEDQMPFGPIQDAVLSNFFGSPADEFTDVHVDAFAIASYSDGGQASPEFAGSVLASGWVDDIAIETSEGPLLNGIIFKDGLVSVEVQGRPGWQLWLEKTTDFMLWETCGFAESQESGPLQISDRSGSHSKGFYRVRGNAL